MHGKITKKGKSPEKYPYPSTEGPDTVSTGHQLAGKI
jgi:hypothetical protein